MNPEQRIKKQIEDVHSNFSRELQRRTKPIKIARISRGKTFAGEAAELIAESKRHHQTEGKLLTLISRYITLKKKRGSVELPNAMADVLTSYIIKPRQPQFHPEVARKKGIVDAVKRHHEKVRALCDRAEQILTESGMSIVRRTNERRAA